MWCEEDFRTSWRESGWDTLSSDVYKNTVCAIVDGYNFYWAKNFYIVISLLNCANSAVEGSSAGLDPIFL